MSFAHAAAQAAAAGYGRAGSNQNVAKLTCPKGGVGGRGYMDAVTAALATMRSELLNHPMFDSVNGRKERFAQLVDDECVRIITLRLNSLRHPVASWRRDMDTCTSDDFVKYLERGMGVDLPTLDVTTQSITKTAQALLRTFPKPFNSYTEMVGVFAKIQWLLKQYDMHRDFRQLDKFDVREFDPEAHLTLDINTDTPRCNLHKRLIVMLQNRYSYGLATASVAFGETSAPAPTSKKTKFFDNLVNHVKENYPADNLTVPEFIALASKQVSESRSRFQVDEALGADYEEINRRDYSGGGGSAADDSKPRDGDRKRDSRKEKSKRRASTSQERDDRSGGDKSRRRSLSPPKIICRYCGKLHKSHNCRLSTHPDRNSENTTFAESEIGSAYMKLGKRELSVTAKISADKSKLEVYAGEYDPKPSFQERPERATPRNSDFDRDRNKDDRNKDDRNNRDRDKPRRDGDRHEDRDRYRGNRDSGGGGGFRRPSDRDAKRPHNKRCKCDKIGAALYCTDCLDYNDCADCDEISYLLAIDEKLKPTTSHPKPIFTNRRSVLLSVGKQEQRIDAVVDTGCTHRNFISTSVADWLRSTGALKSATTGRVCTAFGQCKELVENFVAFDMTFHDNVNNTNATISISATVLDIKNLQLVLGLPTICKHDLVNRMLNMPREKALAEKNSDDKPVGLTSNTTLNPASETAAAADLNQQGETAQAPRKRKRKQNTVPKPIALEAAHMDIAYLRQEEVDRKALDSRPGAGVNVVSGPVQKGDPVSDLYPLFEHKSVYINPEPAAEEIPEASTSYLSDMLPTGASDTDERELPGNDAFHGPASLQKELKQLCAEFADLFSSTVRKTPAKVTPMEIEIDDEKRWCIPKSRSSPRPQSPAKMVELKRQIEELLRCGVLRASRAEHASQVLLVVKKGTEKLRFCVDYRELNDVTQVNQWVIPNIGELLQRLGAKRSKFFAVMDLTAGYHQAPLSERSRIYSAFTSAFGIFEWTRVVMGLKGACSYFQRMMTTEVLKGLIHCICESYLDDILTTGTSEAELVSNLRQIFLRFRAFNITLNPKKCRFGLTEVEYVGHVINEKGLTFTRNKIDSVINFPKPRTQKDMKQFLGLANFFRAHVRDHSSVARPLTRMTEGYRRSKRLEWSPEADAAFEELKRLIDACPLLFFCDEKGLIFLQTDASKGGIGAYLFQRITQPDGSFEDQPIEFISKAFSKEQRKWSTNEQEAYAIFYTLRKLDYLLRDVKFVLQTDHMNLVFVNNEASPKVKRWKLALQEYNFDIEHIPGRLNTIADAFSRLIINAATPNDPEDIHILEEWQTFREYEGLWDEEMRIFEGPSISDEGVEQFYSLEVEHEVTAERLATKRCKQELYTPPEVYDHITAVHCSMVGHHGVRRTVAKLRAQGLTFSHMHGQVDKFIKNCAFCQKTSARAGPPISTLPFTLAAYGTMNKLHIDSMGPLPIDDEGYQHILVVIDAFTRWVMLYPLKTLTAVECASALIQHTGIFGTPGEIVTDGGPQLNNDLVTAIIQLIGSQHKLTLAHSHQENAIVERVNKEVGRHLRSHLFDANVGSAWRTYLPFVQRVCNTEIVDSTGVAPADILFGGALKLDRGLFQTNKTGKYDKPATGQYISELVKAQKATIDFAAKRQLEKDSAFTTNRTAAISEVTQFAVGSYVLMDYPDGGFLKHAGPPHKLMTKHKGPLQVLSNTGAEYELLDLSLGRTITAHVSRLRPFSYDSERTDPVAVAAKDRGQWVVEKIVSHRGYTGEGKSNRIGHLFLETKWLGSDETTWESWSNQLRNNSVAHAYMRKFPHLAKNIALHHRNAYDAEQAALAPKP